MYFYRMRFMCFSHIFMLQFTAVMNKTGGSRNPKKKKPSKPPSRQKIDVFLSNAFYVFFAYFYATIYCSYEQDRRLEKSKEKIFQESAGSGHIRRFYYYFLC